MQERKSEYQVRKEKLDQIRQRGINPYVETFDKTHTISTIVQTYEKSKKLRDAEEVIAQPAMQVHTA